MEALWRLEDKWKVSTEEAVIVLAGAALLVAVGLCTATALKRRGRKKEVAIDEQEVGGGDGGGCGSTMKEVLMGSVRWSKWREEIRVAGSCRGGERWSPLLGRGEGWQSHNSESPVWQRPILMGEKCELPRFSGLILYDERGRPLDHHYNNGTTLQESMGTLERATTLRDLL